MLCVRAVEAWPLAARAHRTIALAKAAAREVDKTRDGVQPCARLDAIVEARLDSRDYVEGGRAFREKHKPNVKGKSLPVVNYSWSSNTPQLGIET